MNKAIFSALILGVSGQLLAYGLPGVDLKVGASAQNTMTALKVLQDKGIKCNDITSMVPKGTGMRVQCDGGKYYTLIKSAKGKYVMKTN